MKSFLKRVRKSLAYQVLFALAAVGAAANAHDLPYTCPFASPAWQALGENCLDLDAADLTLTFSESPLPLAAEQDQQTLPELFASQPDDGQPPAPLVDDLVQLAKSFEYDGVDCSKFESLYRGLTTEASNTVEAMAEDAHPDWPASVAPFRLDRSFASAGTCDFEPLADAANLQHPEYIFRRPGIQDTAISSSFPGYGTESFDLRRDDLFSSEELAVAIPTEFAGNAQVVGDLLDRLEIWECRMYVELTSFSTAEKLGRWVAVVSNYVDQMASDQTGELAALINRHDRPFKLPLFAIYQTKQGSLAIPMDESLQCEEEMQQHASEKSDMEDFKVMLELASSKLKWAGGRLSFAANYLNDWFSDRVARSGDQQVR
jgi:hypothetical protein